MKEVMSYPFVEISSLAKKESWRKEVNRPIYHLHKWWAQRLGSVFRANVIHSFSASDLNEWDAFYQNHDYGKIILDPFMGSGTTLGEALKLGCNTIGCDINPVSSFLVENELTNVDIHKLEETFQELNQSVGTIIRSYHQTLDNNGHSMDVLYYFWVMLVTTPKGEELPLFKNYIVSKNAYPQKKPEIQVFCPQCGSVFPSVYQCHQVNCPQCGNTYDPWIGTVVGNKVFDSNGEPYRIASLMDPKSPPKERMYALLAVDSDGNKHYLPIKKFDLELYSKAEEELNHLDLPRPLGSISSGINADQPKKYGYLNWSDLYNSRELLSLGLLLKGILSIEDAVIRNQFMCLFDGVAEFNNRFCSYKGEGTGAIRPIFSNHILKPERMSVENSVWGFAKSSGCFSSLFASRLLKAKKYLNEPFEIQLNDTRKVVCSKRISPYLAHSFDDGINCQKQWALVLNGDSGSLPIPDQTVDAIITDPPYFDFVNYSELSDFFYSWLKSAYPDSILFSEDNSRREGEVQQSDFHAFSLLLSNVFAEGKRVLKDDGLLMFSFHHSRLEGWIAIRDAIKKSGFFVSEVWPVYAELSAATPKSAAKEPISVDMLIVCRKSEYGHVQASNLTLEEAIRKLTDAGIHLSKSDLFVIESGFSLLSDTMPELLNI